MSNEQPKSNKPSRVSLNPQTEIMANETEGEDMGGGKKPNATDPTDPPSEPTDTTAMLGTVSKLLADLQAVASNLASATAARAPGYASGKTPGVSPDLRPNDETYLGERGNSKQALAQWAHFTSPSKGDDRLDLITGTGDLLLSRIDKKAGPNKSKVS